MQSLCHLKVYTSKNTMDNFTQKRCFRNTNALGYSATYTASNISAKERSWLCWIFVCQYSRCVGYVCYDSTEVLPVSCIIHTAHASTLSFILASCRVYQSEHRTPTPSHSRATSSANGACSKIVPIVLTSMLFNGAEQGVCIQLKGVRLLVWGRRNRKKNLFLSSLILKKKKKKFAYGTVW
jgi:hypothetical protein